MFHPGEIAYDNDGAPFLILERVTRASLIGTKTTYSTSAITVGYKGKISLSSYVNEDMDDAELFANRIEKKPTASCCEAGKCEPPAAIVPSAVDVAITSPLSGEVLAKGSINLSDEPDSYRHD